MRLSVESVVLALAAGLLILSLLMLRWAWRRLRRRELRAFLALQSSRRRLHSLASQAGFMAFSVDQAGIISWVEGADTAQLGVSGERSTGRHYSTVFAADVELQREIRDALRGQATDRRVTNGANPHRLSIQPIFGEDGRPTEVVAAAIDIGDEVREQERADRLARFRSEFLAAMNFRLRAPLSGIVGVTGLLSHRDLAADERELVTVIEQSSDTLLHFIDDLIDYGELDAGRLELNAAPFDLKAVLERVEARSQDVASQHGLALVVRYPHDVARHFHGDAQRVEQIVANLTANALTHTREGHVLLDVRESERQVNETRIEISVEDTGPGIAEAVVEHLFEGFGAPAHASPANRTDSTGLGLAISRHLARLMGGDLVADSRSGSGSTFTLSLELPRTLAVHEGSAPSPQLLAQPASDGDLEPTRTGAPRRVRRALVAEDSLVQQKVVEKMLQSAGFEVEVASNGREAVAAVTATAYDIVFMDCQMPEMDGFEATAQIRALDSEQRDIPIVAMTADAMPGDRTRCLDAGMNDYLSKPVNLPGLQATADRWVPLHRADAAGGSAASSLRGGAAGEELEAIEELALLDTETDSTLARDLIDAFLDSAPAQLIGTRDGVTSGVSSTVEYWLTLYRTSCHLVGAVRSEQLAEELLEQARRDDFASAEVTLEAIEREFPGLQDQLINARERQRTAA